MRDARRWLSGIVLFGFVACGSGPDLIVPTTPSVAYSEFRPLALNASGATMLYVVGHALRTDGLPEGVILRSENGGSSFRRQAREVHDLAGVGFQSVGATDRLRIWVGGTRTRTDGQSLGVVFISIDGGNHWRETTLPQDPSLTCLEVQGLALSSDLSGEARVRNLDLASNTEVMSTFVTTDGGRSWVAAAYREPASDQLLDRTVSYLDSERGYRLSESRHPGHTILEITGSGGRDWMPVAELAVGLLDTY